MRGQDIHSVSVLGSGIMGHGIAQSFLMGGYRVSLYDIEQAILDRAKSYIERNLKVFSERQLVDPSDDKHCMERLTTTVDLPDWEETRTTGP